MFLHVYGGVGSLDDVGSRSVLIDDDWGDCHDTVVDQLDGWHSEFCKADSFSVEPIQNHAVGIQLAAPNQVVEGSLCHADCSSTLDASTVDIAFEFGLSRFDDWSGAAESVDCLSDREYVLDPELDSM